MPKLKRREIRELAFKAIFANDIENGDPLQQLSYIAADSEMAGFDEENPEPVLDAAANAYAGRLVSGVISNKTGLDEVIGIYSIDWGTDRIGRIERCVLRMGFFELLYEEKLPPAIAIDEALRLTRKYGTPESVRFINGILGKKAEELKDID